LSLCSKYPNFINDPELKFSWSICIIGKHISTKGNLRSPHECKQHSHRVQFLNNEDGSKINLLVNSHRLQHFPNGQSLVCFSQIGFPISYKLECEIKVTVPIFMKFCTFPILLHRDIFYAFPSYYTFFLKVYTLYIFFPFKKNYFSNFKVLPKKKCVL